MRRALPIILLLITAGVGVWLGQRRPIMPQLAGPTLYVSFIDVGEGDSALIQTPDGCAALVDAGTSRAGPATVEFLRQRGVSRLDLLILTHPHSDHIGGAQAVLEAVDVEHVLDSGCNEGSPLYERTLRLIADKRIPYKVARAGQVFRLGAHATIQVLLPDGNPLTMDASAANNRCIAARVSFGRVNLLLLSDIESEAEGHLIAGARKLKCDVLKVAHHGAYRSTSNELLRVAQPRYAVISVGAGNEYGHPNRETLRRLAAAGVVVERTDKLGTVSVATDGRSIRVWGER